MAESFLSEIRVFSFAFPPAGWALCDGQELPINQNQALFSLLGTTYGGNGQTTFALPDLQGRTPIHVGNAHPLGDNGGEQSHTLTLAEEPVHTHVAAGTTSNSDSPLPGSNLLGAANNMYAPAANLTALSPSSVGNAGGGQPHQNMQPFLTLTFCIALQGIFPSES